MVDRVSRRQVLAYRAAAQALHRVPAPAAPGDLAVLDLGVQDTPQGSAATAFAVRGAELPDDPDQAGLATTWTTRGAPHVHRRAELVWWSRALWPWSDEDAFARLDTGASPVRSTGLAPREVLRSVAGHLADIVREPMPKGEVSTALTPRIPEALTVDCRRCAATHIAETPWRASVLPAGITFDPSARAVVFVPDPDWPGVPQDTVDEQVLIARYLRLLGPAGPSEVAAYLGTRVTEVEDRWPEGLVEVEVDGARRWLPEADLPLLLDVPSAPQIRLVPPSDPWLQARDRRWLVPDDAARKQLWPILGRPGALLLRGEVAGVWRARRKGRYLDVAVTTFRSLPASAQRRLDDEAQLVAASRGAEESRLTVSST